MNNLNHCIQDKSFKKWIDWRLKQQDNKITAAVKHKQRARQFTERNSNVKIQPTPKPMMLDEKQKRTILEAEETLRASTPNIRPAHEGLLGGSIQKQVVLSTHPHFS
jgi:hypothetical protein